jgi:hypothetical protein
MNPEDISLPFVEPGDQHQFRTFMDTVKAVKKRPVNFKPCVGPALPPLMWAVFSPLQV